jgi:hypothetical protein
VLVELRCRPPRSSSSGSPASPTTARCSDPPEELDARVRAVHAERADRYAEVADLTVDAVEDARLIVHDILEWAMAQGDVLTPSEHEQVMTT